MIGSAECIIHDVTAPLEKEQNKVEPVRGEYPAGWVKFQWLTLYIYHRNTVALICGPG